MAITLGGVTLHSSLVLRGNLDNEPIFYSITPTLGGTNVIQTMPNNTGRRFELLALDETHKQGVYCTSQIEALQAVANVGDSVTLDYDGDTYTVYILDFTMNEWYSWEPQGPNKAYSGSILLQEA